MRAIRLAYRTTLRSPRQQQKGTEIASHQFPKIRFFAISSGLTGELEFACDEVNSGGEVAGGAIAPGFGLGGLNEAVDAFEDAVVDPGSKPA